MPVDDKKQPIIVKKIKKHGHGHHGGAWKVAYADFVTAMMAFFLLMWLLSSTTESQRAGISNFFQDPSTIKGPGGASTSMIKLGGAMELPKGEGNPLEGNDGPKMTLEEIVEDKRRLDELMERLKETIEQSPSLQDFKDQLLLDVTSEGLRIQIVDKKNRPMFDLGSARLKWYTKDILHEIAGVINKVPNHVSVAGHTDATPFRSKRADYTNWELSADRANAARRELVTGGMVKTKFGRVVGLADSVLFNKVDPYNPVNRRISIIVLNKATEKAIGLVEEPQPAEETTLAEDEPAEALPATESEGAASPVRAPVASGTEPPDMVPAEAPADAPLVNLQPIKLPFPEAPADAGAAPSAAPPEPAPTAIPPEFAPPSSGLGSEDGGAISADEPLESVIERLLGPPPVDQN